MSIGENIKRWRELRNLKQADLAEIIGVSDKTVSSWEINRTEPKMGMVEKICAALNCKKTDIVGEDDPNVISTDPNILLFLETTRKDSSFKRLIKYYSMLNDIGKRKALDNMEDLAQIYSNDSQLILNAAHERTDIKKAEFTQEAKQHDEDIMDDPNF